MDHTLRDQQSQWRDENRPHNPASEGELLDPERALGHLVMNKRQRILGVFTFSQNIENGGLVSLDALLPSQQFEGVKIVGAVSTLLGQEGLLAQCLWYTNSPNDWFWVSITDILKIEVREDSRFRGGTRCIWLTTAIAEYAMAFPHPRYHAFWDSALAYLNAPRLDAVGLHEYRPHWWPDESAGMWPGQRRPGEPSDVVSPADELQRLTEQLSVAPGPSRNNWRRVGHSGDARFPGQPSHRLDQLEPWNLRFDGGIKVTSAQRGDVPARLQEDEGETSSEVQGAKRKTATHGGRRVRWRRK